MRYCLAPHCPELVEGRAAYCEQHAPRQARLKRGAESSGWARGIIRRKVLRRAGWVCEIPGCHEPATECDHIVNRAEGGVDEMSNLQALCPPHHREKTERERLAGLARSRERRR